MRTDETRTGRVDECRHQDRMLMFTEHDVKLLTMICTCVAGFDASPTLPLH